MDDRGNADAPGEAGGPDDASALMEENEALRARLTAAEAKVDEKGRVRRVTIRRWTAGALVVLTSLSVVAATVGIWAHRTVFDTDHFVSAVAPVLSDPEVRHPLAQYLTDQAFEALAVEDRVEAALASTERLAAHADLLAGPIAEGARIRIQDRVEGLLASETFQNLWRRVLRVGHEKIVALLREEYEKLPNVQVGEGEVRLNLIPAIAQVLRNLAERTGLVDPGTTIPTIEPGVLPDEARARLESALGHPLPEDLGQVTVMSEAKLSELQDAVRAADLLVWALVGLTVVLVAATLLVSPARRRTLVQLGIGIVVALFLGGVVIRRIRDSLLESITSTAGRGAARDVFTATMSDLRSLGLAVLWVTVVVGLVAYLAGRPRWFTRALEGLRRLGTGGGRSDVERWVAAHADGLRFAVLALGAVVLFLTGIDWIPVILVGGLAAASLYWLAAVKERAGRASGEPASTPG